MDTKMVNIKIDGKELSVPADYTILRAAKEAGVRIPTLCFLKDINEAAACRICLVEVKGARSLVASCVYPVNEGLEVKTNSPAIREARKTTLELILSDHNKSCLTCVRSKNCELQTLAEELGIESLRFEGTQMRHDTDDLSPSIVRDNSKCILCRRCVSVCKNVQTTAVIQSKNRGFRATVGSVADKSLNDVACIMCGQCITACPVGALSEKSHINRTFDALSDPDLHVVVQTAPAVRAALGEEFGMPIGSLVTGKMITALKLLGFDKVFDTNTGADLTIMEEGTELLNRLKNNGKLPMLTSCSPGWVKFLEHYYPEFTDNLSSCKSPHMMIGALLKTYYAKVAGVDPKKMFVVSVMPCTAKKYEIQRPEMEVDGLRDVDAVLTTRELAKMIKSAGIEFTALEDGEFDNPLGQATGAGTIFGATGGVMEAALRTVAEIVTGKRLESLDFMETRGDEGIKEFTVDLPEIKLKGCVTSGMGNARRVLDKIKSGEAEYHFVEVMGCPGGCVTGGGQPIVSAKDKENIPVWELRASALYTDDKTLPLRRSHENEFVKSIYEKGALCEDGPNGHAAHKLFHTHYTKREMYPEDLMEKPTIVEG